MIRGIIFQTITFLYGIDTMYSEVDKISEEEDGGFGKKEVRVQWTAWQ